MHQELAQQVQIASQDGTESAEGALSELAPAEKLPILLVDDRPENLSALKAVLEPIGYPLRTAASGTEALRLLLEGDFALILLDVRMPVLDGLETARMIKSRDRSRETPIVFLTASRDEIGDIVRGYGIGAVDYVLKPFDPELLRSKVAVFAQLEESRRALRRSEAFLRGAFEAAPIGKTVLDSSRRIIRANPAFARLLGRTRAELEGVDVTELAHPSDRESMRRALDLADPHIAPGQDLEQSALDVRLLRESGGELWVAMVGSAIASTEFSHQLLLAQWVDLSARRRAEEARAELLLEQSARAHAEANAERLQKLQALSSALESLSAHQLLRELALQLTDLFEAELAEVSVVNGERPLVVRAVPGRVLMAAEQPRPEQDDRWYEEPLRIERTQIGTMRLLLPPGGELGTSDHSVLQEAADRAALAIRRAQLHEEEHRIAATLQRGMLPKTLPDVAGVEIAARYEIAGAASQVGGDWYDAFALSGGRLGIIVGDVAGRGIAAATAMAGLRSVARGFALAEEGTNPQEVLTRLNSHQLALQSGEVFTVVYVIIDPGEGMVYWANAGHPPPLLRSDTGETAQLAGRGPLVGLAETTYERFSRLVGSGDALLLYTDGLVERRCEALDVGLDRLARAASGGGEPRVLCDHILRQLVPAEEELGDDVTLVIARIS